MRNCKKLVMFSILIVFIVVPVVSFAGELMVHYSIFMSESDGTTLKGTMKVEVRNLTNGDLQNVDLRLAETEQGPNSIEKGLFQFGSIPGGEARVVTGDFLFDEALTASGEPVMWQVDYDDAEGIHRQVTLPGIKEVF